MIIFRFLDGFDDFWQFFEIFKWLIHENFHVSISMYKRPKIEFLREKKQAYGIFHGEFEKIGKKNFGLRDDTLNRKKHLRIEFFT